MSGGGQALPRERRIRRRREFQRISREGTRVRSRAFVVVACTGTGSAGGVPARLGVTVSRRVGKAVVRNRVKRRIREWFRRSGDLWPSGLDVVIIARPEAAAMRSEILNAELTVLASKVRARWPEG